MKLDIKKINDKVNGLDVKGQGCKDDCKLSRWIGNSNQYTAGCRLTYVMSPYISPLY